MKWMDFVGIQQEHIIQSEQATNTYATAPFILVCGLIRKLLGEQNLSQKLNFLYGFC